MRVVSLFAALAGAIGSVGLMFSEARNAPRFLLVLFAIWVLSPFVGLVLTHAASARWSGLTRTALYGVMIVSGNLEPIREPAKWAGGAGSMETGPISMR